jgi:hypothetical protein
VRLLERCPLVVFLGLNLVGSPCSIAHLPQMPQITKLKVRPESSSSSSVFDFDDLGAFPNLTSLCLENFTVCHTAVKTKEFKLTSLALKDCSWSYPSSLDDVGGIEDLQVSFTDDSLTRKLKLCSMTRLT